MGRPVPQSASSYGNEVRSPKGSERETIAITREGGGRNAHGTDRKKELKKLPQAQSPTAAKVVAPDQEENRHWVQRSMRLLKAVVNAS